MNAPERKYQNEVPITDEGEALILLLPTERWLLQRIRARPHHDPYIEEATYSSGETGELYTGSEYWRIDPALVVQLQRHGFVEGQSDGTYTDHTELRLTPRGFTEGRRHDQERSDKVRGEIAERLERSSLSAETRAAAIEFIRHSSLRHLRRRQELLAAIADDADPDAYRQALPRHVLNI